MNGPYQQPLPSLARIVGSAWLLAFSACATLNERTGGVCGDGVVDQGEACDAPGGVTADGNYCGKPGETNPCQFVPDNTGNCPPGLHFGLDEACYAASAVFGDAGESRGELLQLRKNSDGSVVALYRNGPDLTLATLDSAGGIASSESLLGVAGRAMASIAAPNFRRGPTSSWWLGPWCPSASTATRTCRQILG